MSLGEAKLLFQKIDADVEFRTQLAEIEDIDQRIEFINEHGFNLTLMEIRAAMETLKDEELDSVVGGRGWHQAAPVGPWDLF
jgi:predicted ribosomally synthesized peptide with nif11-like leader